MNDPITRPHPTRNLEVLTEPWHVKILDLDFTIKKGFPFNGMSVPRPLWSVIGSPSEPRFRQASGTHDALFRSGRCSLKTADKIFYMLLKSRPDVSNFKAWILYRGLQVGSWMVWKRYRKRSKDWQKEFLEVK